MRREFFRNARYFFAEVLEVVDVPEPKPLGYKWYMKIQLDDGTPAYAIPSLGHMRMITSEEFVNDTW